MVYEQIPNVHLYREQVSDFIDKLNDYFREETYDRFVALYLLRGNFSEFHMADKLDHRIVIGANDHDAISRSGKEYEYKTVMQCSSPEFKVHNVWDKKDIILRVGSNVSPHGEEEWYLIDKEVLERTKNSRGGSIFTKNKRGGYDVSLPKDPFRKNRDGETYYRDNPKKSMMRLFRTSLDELKKITNK